MIDSEKATNNDFIENIGSYSILELIDLLELYGCDPYYGYLREVTIKQLRSRFSNGDILIHKNTTKRTEEEIEWLVNHNKEVRKETAVEFYEYAYRFAGGISDTKFVKLEDLKEVAIKVFGVEV